MIKEEFLKYLDELFPNAFCELEYQNDYELLTNISLSAQTTDKKVNIVAKELFSKYPTITSLANANIEDVIKIIKPLGLANSKATNIISCAKQINSEYNGKIPNIHEELTKLKGVGNKTANVFLAEFYQIPTFAVDTHVKRVSNRLGFSKSDNVDIIEKDLKNTFPKDIWIKLHHQFIFFGRYFCTSKKPQCNSCLLKNKCFYFFQQNSTK